MQNRQHFQEFFFAADNEKKRNTAIQKLSANFNHKADYDSFSDVWDNHANPICKRAAMGLARAFYPSLFNTDAWAGNAPQGIPEAGELSPFQRESLEAIIKSLACEALNAAAMIDGLHGFRLGLMSAYAENPNRTETVLRAGAAEKMIQRQGVKS